MKKSKFRQLEDLYFAPKYLCSMFRKDPLRTVGDRFSIFRLRHTDDDDDRISPCHYSFAGLKTSEVKENDHKRTGESVE